MKDNFGSSFMIYILLTFLGIYVVFIALTLRYAQAFRAKNALIDIIEQFDGVKDDYSASPPKSDVEEKMKEYLASNNVSPNKVFFDIINISSDTALNSNCYYRVVYYIDWNWPFFNLKGTWKIKGETKNVKYCGIIDKDNLEI